MWRGGRGLLPDLLLDINDVIIAVYKDDVIIILRVDPCVVEPLRARAFICGLCVHSRISLLLLLLLWVAVG